MIDWRPFAAVAALALVAVLSAPAAAQENLMEGFETGSSAPIEIDADSLEVAEEETARVSTFSGNVTVRRGPTTLKAAKIIIYSDPGEIKQDADLFNRIEATGGVFVNSGEQTATGDRASFNMKSRVVTLSGNVVLTQGTNVINGDQLVVDLNSGRARIERTGGTQIRGVFTPSGSGGLR
jgi:lipopolysaccharide export system protein LptA